MIKNKSFTLIELLVVIVIIGILAGVIMISTSSSIDKANIAKSKVFAESIKNNLMLNLISEWKFDNGMVDATPLASEIIDSWGINNAVQVTGDIKFKAEKECINGTCVFFPGVAGNCISFGNPPSLQPHNADYSIEFWYKAVAAGYSYIAILDKGNGNSSTNDGYHFWLDSTGTSITYNSGSGAVNTGSIFLNTSLNNWHHVFLTNDRDVGFTFYLDGKSFFTSKNSSLDTIGETYPLFMGRVQWVGDMPYNGYIDEVRIFGAALSSSQIKQNYIAGLNSMLANGNISKQEYNERINVLAYEQE